MEYQLTVVSVYKEPSDRSVLFPVSANWCREEIRIIHLYFCQ